MDPDSSTGGINDNSESGELDSLPGDREYHFNYNSRDSLSKQSANSERTNIDALDDTARDTIIPPLEDSSSSTSVKRLLPNDVLKSGDDHDLLDFGGDGDDGKEEGEEDDSDEGELIEHSSAEERSPGEISCSTPVEEEAQLDGLEDGEVNEEAPVKRMIKTSKIREKEEGVDELEEGEVSDDDDRRNKGPMPICRFFGKGQCTWGSNCRFLHPGVIDKGLYTMFDKVKPPPPVPNFPILKPGLLGHAPPNFPIPPALIRLDEPVVPETPWERAQRQAKELMKQSEKIKETDIDFEDKKMNLTLTQEEFDKENDYYVKKLATPDREPPPEEDAPEVDEWDLPSRRHPLPPKIDPDFVRERVHHLKPGRGIRQAPPRDSIREAPPLHEPEVRMVRESAFRRTSRFHNAPDHSPPPVTRAPPRGGSYEEDSRREKDRVVKREDWRDPWVRKDHKKRKALSVSKRSSYSSGSSRSSSSSSRSSKSSKSSRSRSRSSKSSNGSPRKRKTRDDVVRKAPPRRPSPKPLRIAPPLPSKDEFVDRRGFGQSYNRPPRYAPPPPRVAGGMKDRFMDKPDQGKGSLSIDRGMRSTKRPLDAWDSHSSSSRSRSRSWSPPSKSPGGRRNTVAKRSKFSRERSRSKSARKPSWSRSSSASSSGSSVKQNITKGLPRPFPEHDRKTKPPIEKVMPVKQIKVEPIDERVKLKTESQSKAQKVKLTLRPSSGLKVNKSILDKLADDVMGEGDEDDNSNPNSGGNSGGGSADEDSPNTGKMKASRREELLKQLQKVEEAIAKKRSKIS